jgi:hypothetical protein
LRLKLPAFCIGVFWLQQQPSLPDAAWLWALPLVLTPFLLPHFERAWPRQVRMLAVLASCAVLGFAWAGWRAQARMADALPPAWEGVDVRVVGVVAGLPDRDAHGERFDFRVENY